MRIVSLTLIAAVLLCSGARAADLPEDLCVFTGTVAKLADGDTFYMTITEWPAGCGPIQVRLLGIDTPESAKQFANKKCPVREVKRGLQAKARAKALLPVGSVVTVRGMGKADTYGRRLGHAENAKGQDVATLLLSEGLAKPYDPIAAKTFTKPNWCQ
jgi:endonuclease YncB( thermonuclease family)